MNITRACVTGVDKTMEVFDLMSQESPYYSVWYNKSDKYFQYNGDDYDVGRKQLQDNLSVIAEQGDNAMYYLKIHPKSEPIYKRSSEEICSFPFRLNPLPEQYGMVNGVQPYGAAGSQLSAILERMETRLAAMEAAPPVEEKLTTFDQIAGILDHPAIAPAVGTVLGQLLPKIISLIPGLDLSDLPSQNNAMGAGSWPPSQINAMQPAINGVPEPKKHTMSQEEENEKVNAALDRLENHCDLAADLTLLANMAESNPQMFKMLLSSLRSQQ